MVGSCLYVIPRGADREYLGNDLAASGGVVSSSPIICSYHHSAELAELII